MWGAAVPATVNDQKFYQWNLMKQSVLLIGSKVLEFCKEFSVVKILSHLQARANPATQSCWMPKLGGTCQTGGAHPWTTELTAGAVAGLGKSSHSLLVPALLLVLESGSEIVQVEPLGATQSSLGEPPPAGSGLKHMYPIGP